MDAETYLSVVALIKRKEEARIKAREKYRLEHQVEAKEPKAPKAYKPKASTFKITKLSYDNEETEPVVEALSALQL